MKNKISEYKRITDEIYKLKLELESLKLNLNTKVDLIDLFEELIVKLDLKYYELLEESNK